MTNTWDLIVACLFHRGSCALLLDDEARRRIWEAADGYGRLTRNQLETLGLFEDWSHIRDSSDDGQQRIAAAIKSELRKLDRARRAKYPDLKAATHYAMVRDVIAKLGKAVA